MICANLAQSDESIAPKRFTIISSFMADLLCPRWLFGGCRMGARARRLLDLLLQEFRGVHYSSCDGRGGDHIGGREIELSRTAAARKIPVLRADCDLVRRIGSARSGIDASAA